MSVLNIAACLPAMIFFLFNRWQIIRRNFFSYLLVHYGWYSKLPKIQRHKTMPIVLESCRPKIFYVLIHSLLNSSILGHILMSSSRTTHSAPLICLYLCAIISWHVQYYSIIWNNRWRCSSSLLFQNSWWHIFKNFNSRIVHL